MDNNNAGDSNSSDSNEGNEAYRYIGQRGLLAPIYSRLKLKRAIKQRSYLSPLILSIYTSNRNAALSSNYYKRARSPIYNCLCI